MTENRTPELQKQQIMAVVDAMLDGRDAEAKLALKDLFHGDSSNVALNFERLQLIKGGSGLFAGLASAFGKDPEAIEKEKEEKRKEMAMLLTLTVLSNPPMRAAPPPVQKEPEFEVIVGPLEDLGPDYVPEVAAVTAGTVAAVAAGKYLMDSHKTKAHVPEADDADKDKKRKSETEIDPDKDKDKDKKTNKTDPDSGKDQKSKTPDAERHQTLEPHAKHGDVDAPHKASVGKPKVGWIGLALEAAVPLLEAGVIAVAGKETISNLAEVKAGDSETIKTLKTMASHDLNDISKRENELGNAYKEGGITQSAKVIAERAVGKEISQHVKDNRAGLAIGAAVKNVGEATIGFGNFVVDGAKSTYTKLKDGDVQKASGDIVLGAVEVTVGQNAADLVKAAHHDLVGSAVDGIEWAAKKAHDLTSPHKTDPPKTQTAAAEKPKDHGTASAAQAHDPDATDAEKAKKAKSAFAAAAAHPDSEKQESKPAAPEDHAQAKSKPSPETSKKAFAAATTPEKPEAATPKTEVHPVHVAAATKTEPAHHKL